MSSAELRENRTLGRSASGDGRKGGTSDCADEVTLSRKGANSRTTRGRKLRSTGTKAKARVSNRPNSLSELKKQLEARTRELAEVRGHLSEALEQQTATSEVLRAITGSPGDLKPVFEAILTNARRLCEAKFGHLLIYDGEYFRVAAVHVEIPEDMQKKYGFPAVGGANSATKQLIFGANAARLYRINLKAADTRMPAYSEDRLASLKSEYELAAKDPSNLRYGYVRAARH